MVQRQDTRLLPGEMRVRPSPGPPNGTKAYTAMQPALTRQNRVRLSVVPLAKIGESSNGRILGSDPINGGSNPSSPADPLLFEGASIIDILAGLERRARMARIIVIDPDRKGGYSGCESGEGLSPVRPQKGSGLGSNRVPDPKFWLGRSVVEHAAVNRGYVSSILTRASTLPS